MRQSYKILGGKSSAGHRRTAGFLAKQGQLLLPRVDLIDQGECAGDEMIDLMGRETAHTLPAARVCKHTSRRPLPAARVGKHTRGRRELRRRVFQRVEY